MYTMESDNWVGIFEKRLQGPRGTEAKPLTSEYKASNFRPS